MKDDEEVVDIECVNKICAFIVRSHLYLTKVRIVFVEDFTRVLNETDLEYGPNTIDHFLVNGIQDQIILSNYSWFVKEESA